MSLPHTPQREEPIWHKPSSSVNTNTPAYFANQKLYISWFIYHLHYTMREYRIRLLVELQYGGRSMYIDCPHDVPQVVSMNVHL